MDTERLLVRALAVARRMVGPTPEADVASATAGAALRCAKAWDPERAKTTTFEQYVAVSVWRARIDCHRREARRKARHVPLECAKGLCSMPDYDSMSHDEADQLLEVWMALSDAQKGHIRSAASPDEALARLRSFAGALTSFY